MAGIDLGDDDGFANVRLAGAEVTVDVWKTNARLYEIFNASEDPAVQNEAILDLMAELGLPRGSHVAAVRFANGIAAAAAAAKKNASATAD